MSRIAIKICGLSKPESVGAAIQAGASHLGFVHFPKSPRHITVDQIYALTAQVPAHIERVAVVVDPDDELLNSLVSIGSISCLQLHGKETVERTAHIRQKFGLSVWKAISVKTSQDIFQSNAYAGAVDRLLFDAKTPDGAALPGGMGLRFDWNLLKDLRLPTAWGLSGGLDPQNVTEALRISQAELVDVSSGVESSAGVKDVDKIVAFCNAVSAC